MKIEYENITNTQVVNPTHYNTFKIEPLEYILANKLDFLEGNVIKYVTRHKLKNGSEDIKKAIYYLEIILKEYYNGK